jgi:uncharacterized protein YndB with AHSA1/START domain
MSATIEQEILVNAPLDAVWRAVTEPEHISRWFSDETDLDAKPGYEGVLTFRDRATKQAMSLPVTVESVAPRHTCTYRWLHPTDATAEEGNSLPVTFTLTANGDGTRLHVAETGLAAMGWSAEQQDAYADEHSQGWIVHLGRLRECLAEAG